MLNKPIKLSENTYLYSGDVITINNSNPLLIEIIANQTIKLRDIKDNKYLDFSLRLLSNPKRLKVSNPKLKFLTGFENALTFTVKKDDNGRMSLQTNDNYLGWSNNKDFYLSSEEK